MKISGFNVHSSLSSVRGNTKMEYLANILEQFNHVTGMMCPDK